MFDLKVIHAVLGQLEEERGIPKEKVMEAIEAALATAYKKEYGKRGQIIRANFNLDTGDTTFEQVKVVVDESTVRMEEEGEEDDNEEDEDALPRFNSEQHILLEDARRIKRDAEVGDELVFPLEQKDDYGRISAQTAKQVIIQKIREAEKSSVYNEFEDKQGEIVSGTVQRIERGNVFIDLGRATGIMPYDEQIPGERFRQGERIRAILANVDESARGIYLRLSRSRADFLRKLFEVEAPEVASGIVEIRSIAREPGQRSKIAVYSNDEYIDPVGACVGQRGVRVSTVMSELGGEKIDVVEWHENPAFFVEEALSPARVLNVKIDEEEGVAEVLVSEDQQSLAIGKGGQNARLAAKLTGLKIDIKSTGLEDGDDDGEYGDDLNDPEEYEDFSNDEDLANVDNEDIEESTEPENVEEIESEGDEADEELEEAAGTETAGEELAEVALEQAPVTSPDITENAGPDPDAYDPSERASEESTDEIQES